MRFSQESVVYAQGCCWEFCCPVPIAEEFRYASSLAHAEVPSSLLLQHNQSWT